MEEGSKNNATFALHRDWMTHCDEVVALQLAERLGGKDGYLILLATVKSSLLFQFLNGASSYAPFCVDLLHEYYKCGSFHQGMKHSLFSTPIGNSNVNFSTDTKREMEHIVAIKMLRAGSTEASVLRRMAIIDSIQSVPKFFSSGTEPSRDSGEVNWNFTETDVDHILPTAKLILRRGGLGLQEDHIPCNVYARNKTALNPSILDEHCRNVGEYMLKRYIIKKGLFGCKQTDLPNINTLQGPTDLVQKAKLSKGTTLRRTTGKVSEVSKSEHAVWEEKRQKALDKRMKEENRLTSKMNTCQALVEPNCNKPRVNKSSTMPRALKDLVEKCSSTSDHLIALSQCTLPSSKCDNVQYVTVEFAGTKFKAGKGVKTGLHYLRHTESSVLKPVIFHFKNVHHLVVCEEKYSYTPDDFKAATRKQRQVQRSTSIAHLKTGEGIVSSSTFNKEAVITTAEGKYLIGNFLAANVEKLNIKKDNLILYIDSELHRGGCLCGKEVKDCMCDSYAIPLRCSFNKHGFVSSELLPSIKQRKGEAELAQVDWLLASKADLDCGKAVASFVSSGDIDAVVIHLFAISLHWPRDDKDKFLHPVYVILQKNAKTLDFYDITGIIEALEESFEEKYVGIKVAIGLCMGGNDFVPKFHSKAHTKVLQLVLSAAFRHKFLKISPTEVVFNEELYPTFVKHLYGGDDDQSFEDIRRKTMHLGRGTEGSFRNAQFWMPPHSALMKVARIITLQVQYYMTIGLPDAKLPAFLSSGCFSKRDDGSIEYDFGAESFMEFHHIRCQNPSTKRKTIDRTPRKERVLKKQLTSTPKKGQSSRRRLEPALNEFELSD